MSKEKGINVLSLFDGMSCGQIALNKLGIKVNNYYACEIKKHAISVTLDNFPDTIQLGDVTKVTANVLPKIDLLIGGSPCQDFSNANKNKTGLEGKKSGLFYEYVRLLKETNPKYFLLENVKMKKEWQDIISEILGVEPININSKVISAQLRNRFYWTNIPFEESDIIEKNIELSDILSEGWTERSKSRCLLESDSRPLSTPLKMFHRHYTTGFNTIVFKSENHYIECKNHYDKNFKGLSAKELNPFTGDLSIYDGVRYFNKEERERLQTIPNGYCMNLSENDSACLMGDGWTVDVISIIFSKMKFE